MHLLLIHQAFISPDQPGGSRHFELGQRLIAAGHNFTVVTSDISYLSGERAAERRGLYAVEERDGIRILRAYTYPSLHRSFTWRVVSFLSFMMSSVIVALRAGRVDVVMGTSPPIFQAASAWLVAFLRRRPFLLEIRDLWPEFAIDMGVLRNKTLIALGRWFERFLYARATHILVNSPAYRDYMLARGIPASKVSLIANGVESKLFDPNCRGDEFRRSHSLNGQFVVTYAGALGQANDIDTILRSADRLRDEPKVRFLLVGDGKERRRLEQEAQRMQLTNVTFAGTLPKSQMPEALAASDACLATLQDIPMFRTTYPNKVFDYMAAGRPTILAIDGVIRQVVEAAEGGVFVQPGDDAALADAVRRLARDRETAAAMGRSARTYVCEHFDRSQHAAQFVQLVTSLAGDQHAAPVNA